jgi:FAD/FMN-containing dehydrogenase
VRSAREHGFPLSVRAGGHDWAGRALCHQGLVIDLSPMKRVDVSLDASVATIQGGATPADDISATGPHGLVAATGACGTVGMVGLTLGGGMVYLLHAMVGIGQAARGRGCACRWPARQLRRTREF